MVTRVGRPENRQSGDLVQLRRVFWLTALGGSARVLSVEAKPSSNGPGDLTDDHQTVT
jgi:hypothetical protein